MTSPNGNGQPDTLYRKISEWRSFYSEIFSATFPITSFLIPCRKKENFNQLIIILEGLTARKIVEKMREYMDVYLWNADDDWLDKIESEREPKSTYGIYARDCSEAEDEPNDQISGITLRERLLYEFFYWWKYKKHLDMAKVTRCSGSRHGGDGVIPWVFWDTNKERVVIFWFHPDFYGGSLRDREVIA